MSSELNYAIPICSMYVLLSACPEPDLWSNFGFGVNENRRNVLLQIAELRRTFGKYSGRSEPIYGGSTCLLAIITRMRPWKFSPWIRYNGVTAPAFTSQSACSGNDLLIARKSATSTARAPLSLLVGGNRVCYGLLKCSCRCSLAQQMRGTHSIVKTKASLLIESHACI